MAPNGVAYVNIYDDGFIEFGETIDDETKYLIHDMTEAAIEVLDEKNIEVTPENVFKELGWKEMNVI
jgi:hypothetical protein